MASTVSFPPSPVGWNRIRRIELLLREVRDDRPTESMVVELRIAEQGGESQLPSREGLSAIGDPGFLVDPWEVP